MPRRFERWLQVVCAILVVLLLVQVTQMLLAKDPLDALPTSAPTLGRDETPRDQRSGGTKSPLPPAVLTRVETIKNSEIFGALPRPLPMALLGIAGRDAIIRTPNGQTVLLRENDETAGVKLVRLGTNRVLIEHEGNQKELTVFSGYGGESLLSKEQ